MPSFGERSRKNLASADIKLKLLFEAVVKKYDCSIIEGHRNELDQNNYFEGGQSKLRYPQSKHNKIPSQAVDVAFYPIKWQDTDSWYHFAGYVKGVASQMGIEIRWGGDWDSDYDLHDQIFNDFPHFELV